MRKFDICAVYELQQFMTQTAASNTRQLLYFILKNKWNNDFQILIL